MKELIKKSLFCGVLGVSVSLSGFSNIFKDIWNDFDDVSVSGGHSIFDAYLSNSLGKLVSKKSYPFFTLGVSALSDVIGTAVDDTDFDDARVWSRTAGLGGTLGIFLGKPLQKTKWGSKVPTWGYGVAGMGISLLGEAIFGLIEKFCDATEALDSDSNDGINGKDFDCPWAYRLIRIVDTLEASVLMSMLPQKYRPSLRDRIINTACLLPMKAVTPKLGDSDDFLLYEVCACLPVLYVQLGRLDKKISYLGKTSK